MLYSITALAGHQTRYSRGETIQHAELALVPARLCTLWILYESCSKFVVWREKADGAFVARPSEADHA